MTESALECQDCYGCGTTNCGCPHHEKELE